jgi:hypothetical protein
MSRFGRPALAVAAALALSACGSSDPLVMSRTTGITGTGEITGSRLRNSGEMTIQLPWETFTGRWVAVREGADQSLELLESLASGSVLRRTARVLSETEAGFGTAILRSDRGRSMRCEFRYTGVNITAIGICQTRDGEVFDLQVS